MSILTVMYVLGIMLVASGMLAPSVEAFGSKRFRMIYQYAWTTYLCVYMLGIFVYIAVVYVVLN